METESSSSLSSISDDDDAADIFICILLYLSMMINVPRANMDMVTSRNMAAYQQVKIQILIMKISFVAPQGLMACTLSSRGGLQRLQMHGYLSVVSVVQENGMTFSQLPKPTLTFLRQVHSGKFQHLVCRPQAHQPPPLQVNGSTWEATKDSTAKEWFFSSGKHE